MSATFTEKALFGGAITALIPSRFADVSNIRQVPDNQEVYLDADGFASLTFDIVEYISHLSTDREALEYHFADIVAEEDSKEVLSVNEGMGLPHFPPSTPVLCLIAKITPSGNPHAAPLSPNHTIMHLTLIRLVQQATDIVITLNIPAMGDAPQIQNVSKSEDVISTVVTSFDVKDWNLFTGK
ncbi:hypothetical protein ACLMJK_000238 [Lecanora helva]